MMAKKPTLPPLSTPAKPAPPKPAPAKPSQPAASAGKPTAGKPASGKPTSGKPAPGKPSPGGKPVKPIGGATSGGTIAKPGMGSATVDPGMVKPVREFKGDARREQASTTQAIEQKRQAAEERALQRQRDKMLRQNPISADMIVAARGSRLAQAVIAALQHEGKPEYLTDEQWLKRFARSGWHAAEDKSALEVIRLFNKGRQDVRSSVGLMLAQTDEADDDPCAGLRGNALEQCYISQLSA